MNWLLLRGLGRVQEHWFDFPEKLRNQGTGKKSKNHIECLDLPGFGQFAHVDAPFTIGRHTDFLRTEFAKLTGAKTARESARPTAEPPQWGLIGLSLGGMVALDWASRFPKDFSRLVVINTSSRDLATWLQRFSLFAFYRVGRALSAPTASQQEKEILRLVSNLRSHDRKLLARLVEISKKHSISRANLAKQLTAAAQFKCPEKIAIHTLVISSLKDRMVDSRCSKAIADRLGENAQIKFHPTAGHDLPIDDAEWLAEQINDWAK